MKIQQCCPLLQCICYRGETVGEYSFMVTADMPLRRYEPRSHLATSADSSEYSDRAWLYTGLPEHQYSAILMPSRWEMPCVPGESQQTWHMPLSLRRQTLHIYIIPVGQNMANHLSLMLYTQLIIDKNQKNFFFLQLDLQSLQSFYLQSAHYAVNQ